MVGIQINYLKVGGNKNGSMARSVADDGSFSHNFEFQLRCRGQGVTDEFSQRTETSNTISSSETIHRNTQVSQAIPEEVQCHFIERDAVILCPLIVISGR